MQFQLKSVDIAMMWDECTLAAWVFGYGHVAGQMHMAVLRIEGGGCKINQ
jgi:hypothetical protein